MSTPTSAVKVNPVTGALIDPPVATFAAANGLLTGGSSDAKDSVRVATTANGTLATAYENGDTVDGIVLATGNRILIKNQSAPAENGIYTVNASGAPTRATDFDAWTEIVGAFVSVESGTVNAGTQWLCNVVSGGTLGTTAITFVVPKNFVDLTTTQTIAGQKAFTDPLTSYGGIKMQNGFGAVAVDGTLFFAQDQTQLGIVAGGVDEDLYLRYSGNTDVTLPASGTLATTTGNVATATALATARNIFNISFNGTANVAGDATNTGHFASIPGTGAAGHFITENGTAPTLIAGRSAWYSDGSGVPSYKNGTGTAVTLVRSSDIGVSVQAYDADLTTWAGITPASGIGTFLATPSGANLASALTSALPVSKGGTGLTAGTSGGILAFTATGTIASSALLAANALVIGGGAGVAPSTTTTGANVLNALGVAVGSAGAFTVFGGVGNFSTIVGTSSLTLGVASTTAGSIVLKNATNAFTSTIQSGVVGANKTWTWPTGYGSAGQVLTDAAGDGVLSWTTAAGAGTVTSVAQSFTGGLISVAGSPITGAGTLALTVAGTSGGIPYFSSTSTWATSAALAANAIVIGGGAGAAPSTTTTGTGVIAAIGNNTNAASGLAALNASANLVLGNYSTTGAFNGVFVSNVTQDGPAGSSGGIRFSNGDSDYIGIASGFTATFLGNISVGTGSYLLTGGYIDTRNNGSTGGFLATYGGTTAGGNLDTHGAAGIGGHIYTYGATAAGGNIYTYGAATAGGSISTNGSTFAGGSINTSGGAGAAGGSIDTSNGGGSINTKGVGSIQLGASGTRTTLVGTATADRAISLPNAAGTLALTSDVPSVSTFSSAMCGGRATLTTLTPVLTASVTGAGTIYYTPYIHNVIGLYSGSTWNARTFSELSITLSALSASTAYDCFAYDNGGTVALETLAWTNSTTRATALVMQDGVLCKSGALTRRYLFSFILDGSKQCSVTFGSAAANGGAAQIDLWNNYNRVSCTTTVADTTDSWTYTTNTWRSSNTSNTNRVTLFVGVQTDTVSAMAVGNSGQTGTSAIRWTGIGVDSTSSPSGLASLMPSIANRTSAVASFGGHLGVGSHYLQWLEKSVAAGTTTWYGDNAADGSQTGLTVTFLY